MLKKVVGLSTLLGFTVLLGGCGAGSVLGSLAGGSTTCSPHTVTLNFPATGGFSEVGTITSATTCFSTATVTTNASTFPLVGTGFSSSDPTAATVLYLTVTFNATEYANGLPSLAITMPATVATSNRKFYVSVNSSGGSFGWSGPLLGPATVNGTTLMFSSGGGNTTFDAGQVEELAVYSVAGP